jgi:hypothetical protein
MSVPHQRNAQRNPNSVMPTGASMLSGSNAYSIPYHTTRSLDPEYESMMRGGLRSNQYAGARTGAMMPQSFHPSADDMNYTRGERLSPYDIGISRTGAQMSPYLAYGGTGAQMSPYARTGAQMSPYASYEQRSLPRSPYGAASGTMRSVLPSPAFPKQCF